MALTVDRIYSADASVPVVELGVTKQLWWQDSRLQWTPSLYKGVDMLFFVCDPNDKTSSEIWSPDIQLWNAAQDTDGTLVNTRCYVAHNGTVVWTRPGSIKVACPLDVSDFPFDTPTCQLQMGSWSQSSTYIDLKPNPWIGGARLSVDPGFGEMKMISASAKAVSAKLFSDQEAFSTVQIDISLERAYEFYTSRFMVPLMAITLVSFIAFWVPPSSRERLMFGALLMASEALVVVMLAPRVPVVNESLVITSFVSINLYFCFASLLVSIMSTSLWNKHDRSLFTCTVRAPARWRPPADVRTKTEIEVADRTQFEKLQRCSLQTDLTEWFHAKRMSQFEAVFREQEIHTLEELKECCLTEDDLRDVLKIEPLYTRKVLARHIRELQPREEAYQGEEMAPLIGALVNSIQQGLGGAEEHEEEEVEFVAVVGKPPPVPEPETVIDPDREFDLDDYSEYWQTWSAQIDAVARILLPVVYLVCVMALSGVDMSKMF